METVRKLLDWYEKEKRDLPWRHTKNPYFIWISEIMLQQTRVETVKGYYARFVNLLPTLFELAAAPQDQVLKAWEGLGYYTRARNLQKAAQEIVFSRGGVFPEEYEEILSLPGIGPYTAGAIASIAFHKPVPAIDGNVYRVSSRYFGIREDVAIPSVQKEIRNQLLALLPQDQPGNFNQALMELGATLCCPGTPDCGSCPLADGCSGQLEGDAEFLPIHEKKAPPREIPMGVCLLTYQDKILVTQRRERMLGGLWVFVLLEEENLPEEIASRLGEEGLFLEKPLFLEKARHVFTHRVWEMNIYRLSLKEPPKESWLASHSAALVTKSQLEALPMPTAMKAARRLALQQLENQPEEKTKGK